MKIDRRFFLKKLGLAVAGSSLAGCFGTERLTSSGQCSNKPNVIIINADDLGYGDLSCYGAKQIKTPNIDRLAEKGRMFTDAHSASAVCTPSRYALLTGEYPFRKGIYGPCPEHMPLLIDPKKMSLARLFKENGYATSVIGKWHLGFGNEKCDWNKPLRPGPLELGFDYFFGIPMANSGFHYFYLENDRPYGWDPNDPLIKVKDPADRSPTPQFPEKGQNTYGGAKKAHALYDDQMTAKIFTEKAVKWINRYKDEPFFLYLAPTNIHHPFTPHPRFTGTSKAGRYGDFTHELDWMVGQIVDTVEKYNLTENTLIIFTSDNGGMFNEGGKFSWKAGHRMNGDLLGFKFGVWEGGQRVPFIACWPDRIAANTKSDQLICNVDILSTMAALLGQPLSDSAAPDSYNMVKALTGNPSFQLRDHLILAGRHPKSISIRKGPWIFIPTRGDGGEALKRRGGPKAVAMSGRQNSDINPDGSIKDKAPLEQLYNLKNDPSQKNNCIRDHPEIAEDLKKLLKKLKNKQKTV
jgi:arylsulfatase A-like enzyme